MFSQKYLCCGSHTNQRPQRGSPRHARDGRAHGATSAPRRSPQGADVVTRKTAAAQGRKNRTRLDCRHRTNTRLEKIKQQSPPGREQGLPGAALGRQTHRALPLNLTGKVRKQRSRNETETGTGSRRHTRQSDLLSTKRRPREEPRPETRPQRLRLGAQGRTEATMRAAESTSCDTSGSPSGHPSGAPALRLRACVGSAQWSCSDGKQRGGSHACTHAHTGHRLLAQERCLQRRMPARPPHLSPSAEPWGASGASRSTRKHWGEDTQPPASPGARRAAQGPPSPSIPERPRGLGPGAWAQQSGLSLKGRPVCHGHGRASGHVVVLVWAVLVPLHVVPVYERLDPLLQISRLEKKNRGPNHRASSSSP